MTPIELFLTAWSSIGGNRLRTGADAAGDHHWRSGGHLVDVDLQLQPPHRSTGPVNLLPFGRVVSPVRSPSPLGHQRSHRALEPVRDVSVSSSGWRHYGEVSSNELGPLAFCGEARGEGGQIVRRYQSSLSAYGHRSPHGAILHDVESPRARRWCPEPLERPKYSGC